jgi:hypothetical protein
MAYSKLQVVNFGKSKAYATGSSGVGFIVKDENGIAVIPRTTGSVYEITNGSGNYAAYVSYPNAFHGSIIWDTGTYFSSTFYAAEEFNIEANNPNVDNTWAAMQTITGSIQLLRDMTEGRWIIESNKMRFYKADNTTLIAEFDLFDDLGAPSMDAVFERVRVP